MKDFLIAWKDAAPAAAAITAIISAVVAFLIFSNARLSARRRATLDMVMKTLMDDAIQAQYMKFKALLRKNEDTADTFKIASLAAPAAIGTDDRNAMLNRLNIYELMALGIRRKIFEEAFYKRWYHNQFMKDYEGSREFLEAIQSQKASVFCECSALYRKWLKNGHPVSSVSRVAMAWWIITKQDEKLDAARAKAKAR